MNIEEIQHYLAHRYPFLLIDRVTEIENGISIKGYKNLTFNEAIFQGHFPGQAIFPGVMIIEAMAQLSGILGFVTMNKTASDDMVYLLAGVDNTRFRQRAFPGDRLDIQSNLMRRKRNMWKFNAQAHVEDTLIASVDLICVVTSHS